MLNQPMYDGFPKVIVVVIRRNSGAKFLNEQMDPAEVLAVEIKQYVGNGMQYQKTQLIAVHALS